MNRSATDSIIPTPRIAEELQLIAKRIAQLTRTPPQQAAADQRLADRLAIGSDYKADQADYRTVDRVLPLAPFAVRNAEQVAHGSYEVEAIDHADGWIYAICCRIGNELWYAMRPKLIQVPPILGAVIAGHGWADVRQSWVDAQRMLEDIKADIERPSWGLGGLAK